MSGASRHQLAQRRTRRRRLIAAFIAAVVVTVAAAALLVNRGSSGPKASITVSMTEFAFAPNPIEVAAGDVRITIVNDGQASHDFVLPELGKGTADQRPGTKATLDLSGLRPGTYLVVCDLTGHRAAGMETKLIVR